jgi:hypothetical protein
MSVTTRRALAAAALIVFGTSALTACASPSPEPTGAGTATASAGDSTATEPSEESAPTGPECLIGDWYIAEDQMQEFYSAVSESSSDFSISVSGGTGLSFSETTYTYTPDFAILLEVAGMEGKGAITGAISGDYSATDEEITTSQEVSNIAVTVTVGGTTTDGTNLTDSFLASAPINSAPYECGADGLIIQFDTGDGNPRVPIQLIPAG